MKARHRKNGPGGPCLWRAADMPMLRAWRETAERLLVAVRQMQAQERDPGMLLAGQRVIKQLESWRDMAGRALDSLERTPEVWRP